MAAGADQRLGDPRAAVVSENKPNDHRRESGRKGHARTWLAFLGEREVQTETAVQCPCNSVSQRRGKR